MARRWPRHSAFRSATSPDRAAQDLVGPQPVDVLGHGDPARGDEAAAQLGEHPAHLRPGQPDVGQGVLAHGRVALGPAQQPVERQRPRRVEPGERGLGQLLAPGRRRQLARGRARAPAVEREPQRLEQRGRVVDRGGVHEVEVVGGVPEAVEVGAEAGAPLVGVLRAAARPDRGRIGAHRVGELRVAARPLREVPQRLLGQDRRAVEAHQERRRGRLARPAHERVVEPGEGHLAERGERDDRLHGGVVPGARVQQLLHAVEQLGVGEVGQRAVPPRRDRRLVRGVRDVAPVRQPDGGQPPHRLGAAHRHLPHRGAAVAVVGVAVDGGQPDAVRPPRRPAGTRASAPAATA